MARYAMVLGEALVDLAETRLQGERVYRPIVGGAPLNVAVGLARLGVRVELLTAISRDVLGGRIRAFLAAEGVGTAGCAETDVPTALAVTSMRGAEPDFHFYGEPPSYASLDRVPPVDARIVYCGSISLLCDGPRTAARAAWAVDGPIRALDPNVRPALGSPAAYREIVDEFAPTADLVKLSAPDAHALFDGAGPERAATRLRAMGAKAVVVTMGGNGALVAVDGDLEHVPAPTVTAVDTTGAGDATMAALLYGLVTSDAPVWPDLVRFAVTAGAIACESVGGATAMPTLDQVRARLAR